MPVPFLVTLAIIFVVAAASAAFQVYQTQKLARKAAKDADKRKGLEFPGEGEGQPLYIVYGRAKVGGTRCFAATRSGFQYTAPNADQTFQTGSAGWNGISGTYTTFSSGSINTTSTVGWASTAHGGYDLNRTLGGNRNEFLFTQQVLCVGPINSVKDIIFDDNRYLTDASLGFHGNYTDAKGDKHYGLRSALRVDVHFGATPVADSIMSLNAPERIDAVFDGLAYLSCAFKLDRENPQFSGPPGVQVLIEGRKVYTWNDSVKSGARVYTNNNAWCLADYLLDPIFGKGIEDDEIDYESFEYVANVCATIVQEDVAVGGKFYKNTDNTINIETRDVPLYECNIVIDTSKPIRENIESILATMGDARLIWSNGKYRLSLQYPLTNDDIIIDEEVTDNELAKDSDIDVNWPDATTRLNHCTVRFSNEHENFREDSVSWPPKHDATYWDGIGGYRYGFGGDGWDTDNAGQLLNSYGVWQGNSNVTQLDYLLLVKKQHAGTYTLKNAGDSTCTVKVYSYPANALLYTTAAGTPGSMKSLSVSLGDAGEDKIYKIVVNATNNAGNRKGAAAKIESSNRVLWTTRDATYSKFILVNKSQAVYDQYLAEDGGLDLTTSIFGEGITDPYHALAKAEEVVRTSRSAFTIKYKKIIDKNLNEPGDFVKFNSSQLQLGQFTDLYLRVDNVKVVDEKTAEINASRFDYTQQAWAIKDDQPATAPPIYDWFITAPNDIFYFDDVDPYVESSGKLTCTEVAFDGFAGYIWYAHKAGIDPVDEFNMPVFSEIGRSDTNFFVLPAIGAASAYFGVRSYSLAGRRSNMTVTNMTVAQDLSHSWNRYVELTAPDLTFNRQADASIEPSSITITATTLGFTTPQFKWLIDGVVQVGQTASTLVVPSFSAVSAKRITVEVNETGDLARRNRDSLTLFYLASSFDTYAPVLSQEAHIVPADSTGLVLSYTGATGNFKVYRGTQDVSADFSFSVKTGGNPQNLTVGFVGNVYTISDGLDAGESIGIVTLRAEGNSSHSGIILEKTVTLGKSLSTHMFSMNVNSQTIKYDSTNLLIAGQTLTFTGQKQNTNKVIEVELFRLPGLQVLNANTYLLGSGSIVVSGNKFTMTGSTATLSGFLFSKVSS